MKVAGFHPPFAGQRFMAIMRGLPPAETVELANRAWDLGIATLIGIHNAALRRTRRHPQ